MAKRSRSRPPKTSQPMRCPNCDGGLYLDDPSYGLTCPRCQIRVAGPFESAHEIPDYVPAPLTGTMVATIRFKNAASRRDYIWALSARLAAAGYGEDQILDAIRHSFPIGKMIGHVHGRDDAERAVDVAGEVHGVTADLGRTG